MIDDELVRGAPRAGAVAGPSGHPRHGAEPRRLLPGARDGQPLLPGLPDDRAERDGPLRRADRPPVPPVRLRRRARRRARDRAHGLRRRGGRGDGRVPGRPRREGGRAQGAALPAVLGRALPRRAARDRAGASPCWTAPRSPAASASRCTWTWWRRWPRPWPRAARRSTRCRASSAGATACRPRSSRRPWSRPSSTSWRRRSRKNHFTVGIHDDVTHTSLAYDPAFSTEDPDTVRAVFYGLGADGTVGANKNSIKIIGEETDNYAQGYFVYDSKKSGLGDRLAPALRPAADPLHLPDRPRQLRGLPPVLVPGAVRRAAAWPSRAPSSCSTAPTARTRSGTTCRAPCRSRSSPRSCGSSSSTRYEVARETGMGGRINTIMQTCFFAISGVLPRDEAIAAIKHAIEKTYGKRGEAVVQKNFAAVDSTLGPPARGRGAGAGRPAPSDVRPPVPAEAPEFVQQVTAAMIAGEGDTLPVSALPVDGTYPTGTTQWEKRNIALEIPVWDADLCIQCGKCVLVCPHAVIRAKVYDPTCLAGAPGDASSRRRPAGASSRDAATRCRSRPRTAPAAASASRSARPRARARSATRPSTWCRSRRSASRRRRTGSSSSSCRRPDRHALNAEPGQGRPAAPAAVRVLRRLRRLRRDAVPQAAEPALRRPRRHRQRHRLLVHLRRQPADHAVDGEPRRARAGLGQLAVRGQRRVRPRHALALDKQAEYARELVAPARAGAGRDWRAGCSTPTSPARRASRRSASGSRQLKAALRGLACARGARPAGPGRRPGQRRASGSSAATAGPTTSATAASTTCWPRAAT